MIKHHIRSLNKSQSKFVNTLH